MKKIAVLGGGQVGASVAKILTDDGNDITLVDNNASVLEDLQEENDIKTIQGNASSPSILNQVELSDCDILIATTASDEVNLVSCHLAKKMFNVPNVIARLRNAEYREETSDFNLDLFSIDSIISPSLLVTDFIKNIISLLRRKVFIHIHVLVMVSEIFGRVEIIHCIHHCIICIACVYPSTHYATAL